jgi:hypothetical protein
MSLARISGIHIEFETPPARLLQIGQTPRRGNRRARRSMWENQPLRRFGKSGAATETRKIGKDDTLKTGPRGEFAERYGIILKRGYSAVGTSLRNEK